MDRADPYAVAAVALADGVVLEGQSVAKDQEVARLVDEDARLFLSKAAVGLAESRKQVAEARLASAQADWDNPIEARTRGRISRSDG